MGRRASLETFFSGKNCNLYTSKYGNFPIFHLFTGGSLFVDFWQHFYMQPNMFAKDGMHLYNPGAAHLSGSPVSLLVHKKKKWSRPIPSLSTQKKPLFSLNILWKCVQYTKTISELETIAVEESYDITGTVSESWLDIRNRLPCQICNSRVHSNLTVRGNKVHSGVLLLINLIPVLKDVVAVERYLTQFLRELREALQENNTRISLQTPAPTLRAH